MVKIIVYSRHEGVHILPFLNIYNKDWELLVNISNDNYMAN
jgi:hypothetical protein